MKKKIVVLFLIVTSFCLTGCLKTKQTEYQEYIKATMDASYYGDIDKYIELTKATTSDGEELYESLVTYLTDSIIEYAEITDEYVTDELRENFDELSKKILKKTKYKVNLAKKVNGVYQVKVEIEPIDFWDIIEDDVKSAVDTFNSKATDDATDEVWEAAETEYTNKIYEIVKNNVDKIGYKDSVSKIVEITVSGEHYSIPDEDWEDIDDYVMGLK